MVKVLIPTHVNDIHALAVEIALVQRGHSCLPMHHA